MISDQLVEPIRSLSLLLSSCFDFVFKAISVALFLACGVLGELSLTLSVRTHYATLN